MRGRPADVEQRYRLATCREEEPVISFERRWRSPGVMKPSQGLSKHTHTTLVFAVLKCLPNVKRQTAEAEG